MNLDGAFAILPVTFTGMDFFKVLDFGKGAIHGHSEKDKALELVGIKPPKAPVNPPREVAARHDHHDHHDDNGHNNTGLTEEQFFSASKSMDRVREQLLSKNTGANNRSVSDAIMDAIKAANYPKWTQITNSEYLAFYRYNAMASINNANVKTPHALMLVLTKEEIEKGIDTSKGIYYFIAYDNNVVESSGIPLSLEQVIGADVPCTDVYHLPTLRYVDRKKVDGILKNIK